MSKITWKVSHGFIIGATAEHTFLLSPTCKIGSPIFRLSFDHKETTVVGTVEECKAYAEELVK